MKVLYTADLHGQIDLYRQLFEQVRSSSAEIIAFGGDLLPTLRGSGRYEEMVLEQRSFIGLFLLPFFRKCLIATVAKHVLVIPGNFDMAYPELFAEPVEGMINLDRTKFPVEGYDWIGYPFVPPTPFRPKDYEKMDDPDTPWPPQKNPSYIRSTDPTHPLTPIDPHLYLRQRGTVREDLNRLARPANFRRAIYMMHSPPYDTKLDVIEGGQSVGSRSIRAFIEERQPLLTLHGHIHESPEKSGHYSEWLGRTLSVNPGQPFGTGGEFIRLHAVTFEMERPQETLVHTYFG